MNRIQEQPKDVNCIQKENETSEVTPSQIKLINGTQIETQTVSEEQ